MKKLLLAFICLQSVFIFGQTPTLEWAKQLGGTGGDIGNSVTVDIVGNIYTTGHFSGTADFDPGAGIFNMTSAGSTDVFISKLDASGNFVWAKQLGGAGTEMGNSIAVDILGNVYTTGNFTSFTMDFDPGVGVFNLSPIGGSDAFVSKLDASGNFVWAKQLGGSEYDYGKSITVDASGNVYTVGYFESTADFNPGTGSFNMTSAGLHDIFISKLNSSGNFVWAKRMGGAGNDYANSVKVDAAGNVYTIGTFLITADFDPGPSTFNLISQGGNDVFISKLNSSGNFVWAKRMGGTGHEYGSSLEVDAAGNIYATGHFSMTVDFDPGAGVFNMVSQGNEDVFISRLDTSGNFIWAKQLGGTGNDFGSSITIDVSGNIYIAGSFLGTTDFDPGTGIFNLASQVGSDIFLCKLNPSGDFLWANQWGSETNNEAANFVVVDVSENIYVTGGFHATIDFDPGVGTLNLTSEGITDAFIMKLAQVCTVEQGVDIIYDCYPFQWIDGNTYTISNNTATHTIVGGASNGCDSIVTLNLTINQPTTHTITITDCGSYTLNAQIYTSSGTYTQVLTNTNNCDSTITLNLTINQPTSSVLNETSCGSYTLNSQTYTASGTYTQTLVNVNNCDSTITLNLTINNVDATVSLSGITLTANQTAATYQWIDCDNGNVPIAGETNQSFEPTANGKYAVEVTANGCTETSNCIAVNSVGISSLEQNGWSIYPNPGKGIFTVKGESLNNDMAVKVMNTLGQTIKRQITVSNGTIMIDLTNEPTGMYLLEIDNIIVKLIKE